MYIDARWRKALVVRQRTTLSIIYILKRFNVHPLIATDRGVTLCSFPRTNPWDEPRM
jgi:hypothetical protein